MGLEIETAVVENGDLAADGGAKIRTDVAAIRDAIVNTEKTVLMEAVAGQGFLGLKPDPEAPLSETAAASVHGYVAGSNAVLALVQPTISRWKRSRSIFLEPTRTGAASSACLCNRSSRCIRQK
jgi:hypothetical protein